EPGDQAKERRLARTVSADDADRLTGLDRQRDIAQRPDFLALKVAPPQDGFLERDVPLWVDPEPAADALGDNGSGLHASEGTARVSRTSAANARRKAGSALSDSIRSSSSPSSAARSRASTSRSQRISR